MFLGLEALMCEWEPTEHLYSSLTLSVAWGSDNRADEMHKEICYPQEKLTSKKADNTSQIHPLLCFLTGQLHQPSYESPHLVSSFLKPKPKSDPVIPLPKALHRFPLSQDKSTLLGVTFKALLDLLWYP